eukprot:8837237-Pyramimonas_sp.AAC.1
MATTGEDRSVADWTSKAHHGLLAHAGRIGSLANEVVLSLLADNFMCDDERFRHARDRVNWFWFIGDIPRLAVYWVGSRCWSGLALLHRLLSDRIQAFQRILL